ncbi:MAG: AAA family ATPase [Acidimicrobiia bacterium]|nr:AAA family ATPase [Acidimicrobiia bacterium]
MRIAVVGKGGSGKTTTSAVVARVLGRRGLSVVALDCDSNPNLGISLGVGDQETERLVAMRQALDEGDEEHAPEWDELIDRFGSDAPDGVRLAVVSRIENPDPGCPCCGLSPEQLLSSADFGDAIVLADLEAGIGTLTRLQDATIDAVLIVVEPTPKSIEVGSRAYGLVRDKAVGRVVVVANRIRNDEDLDRVRQAFPDAEIVAVPDDPAIVAADRSGVAALDRTADAPAVLALIGVAERLLPVAS